MTPRAMEPGSGAREASAPNIVLIHIDDLGWTDLGCYGSSFYETPRIDALAKDSCQLFDAYAASPVCSPSRAALMTGRVPALVGITQWIGGNGVGKLLDVPYHHVLPLSEYALPRALRDGGYATWHVGKWHLGAGAHGPLAHGFEVNIAGGHLGSPHTYFAPWGIESLPEAEPGTYLTDALTDHAIELVRTHGGERPFFLHMAHYAVHTPLEAPQALVEKYERKADALGLTSESGLEEGEAHTMWGRRDERILRRTVQSHPTYAAMIENLDTNVGRLLDALEHEDLLEDTLIVFTSDNGGLVTSEGSPTSCAPLAEGKGWTEEGGVRIPMIIRLPGGASAGARPDVLTYGPDLYPTLLEIAGLPPVPRQHVDGISVLPWLRDPERRDDRGPLVWHYPHYSNQGGRPSAAIRRGRFKLIRFFEDEHCKLYDLDADISEEHDLAAEMPETRERLLRELDEHLRDTNALIPQVNPWEEPFA